MKIFCEGLHNVYFNLNNTSFLKTIEFYIIVKRYLRHLSFEKTNWVKPNSKKL